MKFASTYGHSRVQEGGELSTTNISGQDIGSNSKRHSELVIPSTTLQPDSRETAAKQPRIDSWKPHFWPTNSSISPRLKNASSASTTASSSSNSNSSPEEDAGLREWQEEIEKKRRKPSDLLGFFKRKRFEGAL